MTISDISFQLAIPPEETGCEIQPNRDNQDADRNGESTMLKSNRTWNPRANGRFQHVVSWFFNAW